jgi:hypothetical protein
MPEGDAQKKEADQAKPLQNLTLDEDESGGAQPATGGPLGASPTTDAQKKELE